MSKPSSAFLSGLATSMVLMKRLEPRSLLMLQRWASGDDTTSVARAFGVSDDEVKRIKQEAFDILGRVSEKMSTSTDETDDEAARFWLLQFLGGCLNCQSPCDSSDKFCGFCGQTNPLFDESDYFNSMGRTIGEAIRTECNVGHPEMKKHPELWDEASPYCSNCGSKALSS